MREAPAESPRLPGHCKAHRRLLRTERNLGMTDEHVRRRRAARRPIDTRACQVVPRFERDLALPDARQCDVVLKMLADAGKMLTSGDPQALQLGLITDPRIHQHL